jgi:hypothetical protein
MGSFAVSASTKETGLLPVSKPRKVTWAQDVTSVGGKSNVVCTGFWLGNLNTPLGRPRFIWDNIKMDLKKQDGSGLD